MRHGAENPGAWLLTVARHSLIDIARHKQVALASEPTLRLLREQSNEANLSPEFPDERLKLLFVCAHPALDPAMHTPLMLQTVLGLDAARIAHAFLVSPAAMGQRLVRAKTKIRDGGIQGRHVIPIPQTREERSEESAFGCGLGLRCEVIMGKNFPFLASRFPGLGRCFCPGALKFLRTYFGDGIA